MAKKKVTWADVLGQAIPSLPTSFKVPTSKGLVGPPAPRSVTTAKRTPTKRTVTKTTVGDFGGGGDFGTGRVNPPPQAPPNPVEAIATAVTAAASSAAGGLVKAASDQAVPHRPNKPPPQPKKTFPTVKNPSPEQAIYRTHAATLYQQLAKLRQTVDQRESVATTLKKKLEAFEKEKGKHDKATGKWAFYPDDLKQARALEDKYRAAAERWSEAAGEHNDVLTRVWELDRAYKQNTPSPLRRARAEGARVALKKAQDEYPFEVEPGGGGRITEIVGGIAGDIAKPTGEVLGAIGKSLVPLKDGRLAEPGALRRAKALGTTGAVALVEGGKWAGKEIIERAQEDTDQLGVQLEEFQRAVVGLEKKKGRKLNEAETRQLAAGMLPTGVLSNQNLINFAAGAAGALYSLGPGQGLEHIPGMPDAADPMDVVKDIAKLGVDVTVGTGLWIAAMSRPDLTWDQRKAMWAEMPKGIRAEYTKFFGRGLSGLEAFHLAAQDPVRAALLYPLPIAAGAQGARIMTIAAFGLRRGVSLKDAARLARDPVKMRTLTYTERAPKGSGVETVKTKVPVPYGWSSSVAVRPFQRGYDVATKVMDVIPGVRRAPISMSNRAARAIGKEKRMSKTRRGAEVQAHFRNIEQFLNERNLLGQKKNKHYATTLAALVQKPDGFTDAEWEGAVIQNMKNMLADPDRMDLPGDKVSPAEQRLINRIARYDKREQADKARKRGLTMRRVYEHQQRWGENLGAITKERAALHQEGIDLSENKDLMPAAWEDEAARIEGEIAALDAQAQVMREKLAEISVDQPPIMSPKRTQARRVWEDLIYFQDYPQAVEDALLAGDAVARSWAKANPGKNPADWWELRDVRRVESAEDIPLEAYAQTRREPEQEINLPDQEELHRIAFENVDTTVFREHDIGGFLAKIPEYLKRGARYRKWYENSGKQILRYAQGDKELAARYASVIAIYSASRAPTENINLALRAIRRYQESNGETVGKVGTADQQRKAMLALEGEDWGGRKTNRFYGNMLRHIDPERYKREFPGGEVTNDIWMARLFGLKTDSPTPREYEQMTTLVQNVARELGWSPEEVQAALWVSAKADAGRWVGSPKKGDRRREPMSDDDAGIDFATALNQESAVIPIEAAPGRRVGDQEFLRRYDDLDADTQLSYTREKMDAVLDFLREGGLFAALEGTGVGLYKNLTNPAFTISFPLAGKAGGVYGRVERRAILDTISIIGDALNQDAMAWFRPFYRKTAATRKNGVHVTTSRELTPDETLALQRGLREKLARSLNATERREYRAKEETKLGRKLNRDEMAKMNAVRVGGDVALPPGPDGGIYALNFSGRRNVDFHEALQATLEEIEDMHFDLARFEFDGDLRTRGRYGEVHGEMEGRLAGRPDVQQAAHRLRTRSGEIDQRYLGGDQGRAGRGLDPGDTSQGLAGPPRNQSRLNDTLGATQLLDSATGERIIWLTEHADFSTVMHELLGHAAEEMKLLHPEEFASVERVIGKTLEEWGVAEHEQFATWFERYLYEGHAPTPEMVPVFDRSKQYMRTIYGPLRRQLGGRIPHQTRDLFDHYLGGWDSESTSRIAVNMGHFDPSDSPWAGARSAAQGELQTLQKRNRTRRFNQSVEGMMEKLKVLEKKQDEVDNLADQEALSAEIIRTQAEIVLRSDKRVKNLTSKVADMEKALTRDPNNRRFAGALESAKFMMEDRERILREAFGDESFDEMFSNRRDLLANYLVQHGLLQPDFQKGTGTYFPMKLDEGFLQNLKLPMTPASNRIIGEVQKSLVGVHHRNEMIRWQAGDWSADPTVLQLAHARAMSYQFVLEVRETMHQMGRKLTAAERRDPKSALPDGGYVVNLKGTPLSPDMKAATRGMTNTTTVDHIDDGLFGENDKLESTLKDFFRNSIIDIENMPPGFSLSLADDPENQLRFISKNAVNKVFRPVELNLGGRAFDWLNTAARFSLIYANMPGYMVTNLAGNLVFLTAQQGPNWIPRWVFYGKMLKNDDYFRARVAAEGGMLPAFSAVTRGRNFGQVAGERLMRGERWWLGFESKVDEWPRMIAWMAEANKKGYWSKENMLRLLDGKTAKTARDREYVAERTNQHMIDFTYRVGDRERATLGRLLFIWPYIRGATAMPFWYGKNYPARTALMAQLALQQRTYQEAIAGDLPPGREDLYFYSRKGEEGVGAGAQGNVLGTRYFNPAGPVPDEIQMASDLVASLFGRKPDNLSGRLASMLNVNVENTIGLVTGRDAFGRDISLKEQVLNPYGIADTLMPFQRYIRAAFDERYTPRAFREGEGDSPLERGLRSVVRVPNQTVSIDWLNASAQSSGALTTSEKGELAVKANMKHFHRVEGPNAVYPRALRKQVMAKVIYDDRVYALEREEAAKAQHIPKRKDDGTWDFGYHADDYDKAVVVWAVMQQQFPEWVAHKNSERAKQGKTPLVSPNDKLLEKRLPPRSVIGKEYMKYYLDIFGQLLKQKPGPKGITYAALYDQRYDELEQRTQYKTEKKGGVYVPYKQRLAEQRAERAREYAGG